jgi:hypothetical protein
VPQFEGFEINFYGAVFGLDIAARVEVPRIGRLDMPAWSSSDLFEDARSGIPSSPFHHLASFRGV